MTLWFRRLLRARGTNVPLQTVIIGYPRQRKFCAYSTADNDTASSVSTSPTRQDTHGQREAQHRPTHVDVVSITHKWFQNVVLGQKLCPFAAPLASSTHKLRIVASSASNTQQAAADVTHEALVLMRDETSCHETTLVVFDHINDSKESFVKDFRDFVRLSWTLQEKAVMDTGLEGELQLVLFHPKATHQTYGAATEDPADYTIRSPYPTVHLLREQDVVRAVTSGYPHLEELPIRNKARLVAQGLETCQERLATCYFVEK
eukprot:scaffold6420_cov168-Amphora_coffeaeformis.AAC.24